MVENELVVVVVILMKKIEQVKIPSLPFFFFRLLPFILRISHTIFLVGHRRFIVEY